MFDVITVGGATRDVFFITPEGKVFNETEKPFKKYLGFEYGAKIIPEETDFTFGGGGANAAISFAKLGLKTATVLNVGVEGSGNMVVKALEREGVSCDFVRRDSGNHTAMSIVVSVPGHDHTMFLYRGANDFLAIPDWRPMKTHWFYLTSLTGDSVDILPEIFSYLQAHKIKIAWNPGSEQINLGFRELERYLELTDVLILNREEATKLALTKNNRINVSDEKNLITSLQEATRGTVVITDGGEGSLAYDGDQLYFATSKAVDVVETTGAGDAFGSTFVASLIQGESIDRAMDLASTNAANVIRFVGAQNGLMTFDELRAKI